MTSMQQVLESLSDGLLQPQKKNFQVQRNLLFWRLLPVWGGSFLVHSLLVKLSQCAKGALSSPFPLA